MIIFVSDAFEEQYKGGAELTTEAIIKGSLFPVNKVLSSQVTLKLMEDNKSCLWLFGNFSGLDPRCLLYAAKNLDYCVIEYDYKFCKYRSIKKHEKFEGNCECHKQGNGKLVAAFMAKSRMNFWMSKNQCDLYTSFFPFIKNNIILNSVFSDDTLSLLRKLDTKDKDDKWIILNSPSWIKGKEESIAYAKNNNLQYELVWDLEHKELLTKLAKSKGLIFLPLAHDTCPRLVMEAMALKCELVLNEHVQHKDEEWFSNSVTMLEHLSTRVTYFWKKIEEVASDKLKISKNTSKSLKKVKIVIPFYNAEKWLKKCIKSVKIQEYGHFECVLVDDMSKDNSFNVAKQEINSDARFKLIKNKKKYFALENIARAIKKANCSDEDIILLLDGDDWLSNTNSLSTLVEHYEKEDCLMTYGSYVYNPGGMRGLEPSKYPDTVINSNSFRQDKWRASHLRSFTYYLWKNLNQDDLKDSGGKYYTMAYDQAIMLPLLEMSGDRSTYIEESLYVYNKENPLNVDKIKQQQQYSTAQEIRAKTPYKRL
tara:strand:+ start:155 stop:1765 length:1611 start_codon:yes stop_codon:yes gene_type:complete